MGFGLVDVVIILGVTSMVFLLAWFGLPLSIIGAAVIVIVGYVVFKLLISVVGWLRQRNAKSLFSPLINASADAKESILISGDEPDDDNEIPGVRPRAISVQVDVMRGLLYVKS